MQDPCQGSCNRAIVLIELFAGLLPLATAAKELGITIKASYSAEVSEDALTVARSAHSATVQLGDVQSITREVVQDIVQEQGEALYLLSGSLPTADAPHPMTHVTETSGTGYSVDSSLSAYKLVWGFLEQTVADHPGASCIGLLNADMACANSTEPIGAVFGQRDLPDVVYSLGAEAFSHVRRDRLWWSSVVPEWPSGTEVVIDPAGVRNIHPLAEKQAVADVVMPGWRPCRQQPVFYGISRRSPRTKPFGTTRSHRAASPGAHRRCAQDKWSAPLSHYAAANCVVNHRAFVRRLCPAEEEALLQWPLEHTLPLAQCLKASRVANDDIQRRRHSLLGTAWHLGVAKLWLLALLTPALGADAVTSPSSTEFDMRFEGYAGVYEELRADCPYNVDRVARGLSMKAALGPDYAEQHAHKAAANAVWVQPRRSTVASGHRGVLHRGLDPVVQFESALAAASPYAAGSAVADDLDLDEAAIVCATALDALHKIYVDLRVMHRPAEICCRLSLA